MLGELTSLPTDILLEMVFVILAGGQILTVSDVAELEQIQVELLRRAEGEERRYAAMN
jgi:hypothetical protein